MSTRTQEGTPVSDFDPGEGWREVERHLPDEDFVQVTEQQGGSRRTRYWILEEPVPPLPTEPYTVISVTWKPAGAEETYILSPDASWWNNVKNGIQHEPADFRGCIFSFEVLAVPLNVMTIEKVEADRERVRRETAEAVLDKLRFRDGWARSDEKVFDRIRREFGVEP